MRWTQVVASRLPHEKEALDFVRAALPDQEPYRAWSNLGFIAKDGSINEVDALVLTQADLFSSAQDARVPHAWPEAAEAA